MGRNEKTLKEIPFTDLAQGRVRKTRKTILFLTLLVLVLTPTTNQLTSVHAQETTFTMAWGAAPMDTLSPTAITLYDGGAYVIMHAMYDTLVMADQNSNPVPDLATGWTYKNPTTVDFPLVRNATWHDGKPFTADDVVFTFNLFLTNKKLAYMQNFVKTIKSVQALDKYTVEIQTNDPDATLLNYGLFAVPMLPQHIWQDVKNYTSYTNDNPIGTGPFKFVKWGGPNTYVQFDANPNYFYGRPKIDHFVMRYFTSYNAMALALQSGEIDYAGPLIPPALLPTLTSARGIQVVSRLDQRYFYFCFNAYDKGSGNPVLRDKTVRIALSHAINNEELAKVVWNGTATPQNTVIPVALGDWVNPNTPKYSFDLNLAAKMLDDAGYKAGSDGIRVSPTGVKMSLKIEVPSNYAQEYRAAQIIAGWWKQIGIDAKAQLTDVGALGDEVAAWKHDTFDWVWSAGASADPDWFISVFLGSEAQPAPNPGNSDSGFNNATYDTLYRLQKTQTDRAARKSTIWRMQDILHQEAVYVPLYDPPAIQAYRSDRFTGIPGGNLPPENQIAANNLLRFVRSLTATTQTTTTAKTTTTQASTGMSTETLAAIAVAIVVIIAVVAIAVTRRKSSPKGQ